MPFRWFTEALLKQKLLELRKNCLYKLLLSRVGFNNFDINLTKILKGTTMEKIKIEQSSAAGMLWIAGWLFTIGFAKLTFFKGVLAILLWPYYLGELFSFVK
jgi:hypothetical protein